MRHARADYDAIQPWPTKRSHHAVFVTASGASERVEGLYPEDIEHGQQLLPIIPDDEPVFLLRATDKMAPLLVRMWADGLLQNDGDPATAEAIHKWADEMEQYAQDNYDGGKVPDVPEGMLR